METQEHKDERFIDANPRLNLGRGPRTKRISDPSPYRKKVKPRSRATQTSKAMASSINKDKMDALKAQNKRAREMVRACLKEKKVMEKALIKASKKGVKSEARVQASRASAVMNPWLQHVAQFRAANPAMSYKDVLKMAKDSYHRVKPAKLPKSIKQGLDALVRNTPEGRRRNDLINWLTANMGQSRKFYSSRSTEELEQIMDSIQQ